MTLCQRLAADPELARVAQVIREISLADNFHVEAGRDDGRLFVEVCYWRKDIRDDAYGMGHGGKRYLPFVASKDTIVKTVFGAYLAYVEHEARETFLYQGKRIFGPHIAIEALATVADNIV